MARKTAAGLSGLDVGKVATISPQAGLRVTDEIVGVVHGEPVRRIADDEGFVWVTFKNVAPANQFEFDSRAFRLAGADGVEVED